MKLCVEWISRKWVLRILMVFLLLPATPQSAQACTCAGPIAALGQDVAAQFRALSLQVTQVEASLAATWTANATAIIQAIGQQTSVLESLFKMQVRADADVADAAQMVETTRVQQQLAALTPQRYRAPSQSCISVTESLGFRQAGQSTAAIQKSVSDANMRWILAENAPGAEHGVDITAQAIVNDHAARYCSQAQGAQGLCKRVGVVAMENADLKASTLLGTTSMGQQQLNAAAAFSRNVVGIPESAADKAVWQHEEGSREVASWMSRQSRRSIAGEMLSWSIAMVVKQRDYPLEVHI